MQEDSRQLLYTIHTKERNVFNSMSVSPQ